MKSIHVPSPPYRDLRHLTQLRDTVVSELVGMKLRIKSLLLMEGIAFPSAPAGSQWSFMVKEHSERWPARGRCALSWISCSTAWSFLNSRS